MIVSKLKKGELFVISNLLYFSLLFIVLSFFFNYDSISIGENRKYLIFIAISFIIFSAITAFFIFPSDKIKVTGNLLVGISLFFLLLSGVFSVPVSIVATVLFFTAALVYGIANKTFIKPHPLFYIIAFYYIFQLVGLSWSIDFKGGMHTIDKGISYILIPLAFCMYPISYETRNKLLKIFFRSILIFVLIGVVGYIYQIYYYKLDLLTGIGFHKYYLNSAFYGSDFNAIMAWSYYGHPTFLTFIFTLCTGIGVYLYKTEKNSESGITLMELLIFILFSGTLVVVLQSRIGMVMFPTGIFACFLWMNRKNKRLVWGLLSLVFVLAVLSAFYVLTYQSKYFHDDVREFMWTRTFDFIKTHPWLGTGTGGMESIVILTANPHNQYIGEILHLGIVGGLVMLGLLGATIYYGVEEKNMLLLYFMLLLLILMLTEMPLTIQKGVTFFSLYVSLLIRPRWKSFD